MLFLVLHFGHSISIHSPIFSRQPEMPDKIPKQNYIPLVDNPDFTTISPE